MFQKLSSRRSVGVILRSVVVVRRTRRIYTDSVDDSPLREISNLARDQSLITLMFDFSCLSKIVLSLFKKATDRNMRFSLVLTTNDSL